MQTNRISALVVASSLVLISQSFAADMPGLPRLPRSPPIVQDFLSGWYLRADLGYRFNQFTGGDAFTNAFTGSTASEAVAFGGGIGARMQWLRADVTVDYGLATKFAGTTALGSPDATATLKNLTVLFNAYFDLGSWYGVTPYIGAGVGFGWLQASDVAAVLIPAGTTVSNPAALNLNWAAIGGISVPLARSLLLDVNYRYLGLGSARSSTALGSINYGDMRAHEIRMGLRYMLGG